MLSVFSAVSCASGSYVRVLTGRSGLLFPRGGGGEEMRNRPLPGVGGRSLGALDHHISTCTSRRLKYQVEGC